MAANAAATAAAVNVSKKKKKTKTGQKLVVDNKHLGFKATADPNRINIGEIDVPER